MDSVVLILNPPSPPKMDVNRDYAGGYGNAHKVRRKKYGHTGDILMPVSLPYLASGLIKQGCRVKIIDGQAMRLDVRGLCECVCEVCPKLIVTFLSLPSVYSDLRLLAMLKEKIEGCRIVGIGPVARFLADEIMTQEGVDFLLTGELPFLDRPVYHLLHALTEPSNYPIENVPGLIYKCERQGGPIIVRNPPGTESLSESLNNLDITIYNKLPVRNYRLRFFDPYWGSQSYFPILSGKGCPHPCIYCPYPLGFGRRICNKSPQLLIEEMKFLQSRFGIRAFLFRDQVFTAEEQRVREICDLILKTKLNVSWMFETRVDRISPELLLLMKRAGCKRIHYGVETGDPAMLKRIGKPGVSVETIITTFKHTAEAKIYSMAHVIIGLPGENRETVQRTYDLLVAIQPDGVSWNMATPYPGTKLFEMAMEKDLILTYDWQRYGTRDTVMRSEELSARDLRNVMKKLATRFRMRQIVMHGWRAMHNRMELTYLVKRMLHEIHRVTKT